MQNELEKICPILHASNYNRMSKCIGEKCAWWCGFAECCAVPLSAGILADSSINKDVFIPSERFFYGESESDEYAK